MTTEGKVADKLRDLEADAGRYIQRLGGRYADVYDRLSAYTQPDACAEHPAGCGKAAH